MKLEPEFVQAIEDQVITLDEALALQRRFGQSEAGLPMRPADAALWDAISRFDLWFRKANGNSQ